MVMSIDLYIIVGEIRCVKAERLCPHAELDAKAERFFTHDLPQLFHISRYATPLLENGRFLKININGVNRQGNAR